MINHRERFPQWCSEKQENEITTRWVLHYEYAPRNRLFLLEIKRALQGGRAKYSVGKRPVVRIE